MVQVRPTIQTHELVMSHIRKVQQAALVLAKADWVSQDSGDALLHQVAYHDCSMFCMAEFEAYKRYWVELDLDDRTGAERDTYTRSRNAHYACNAHHPEHWPSCVSDMHVSCIFEMVCDWYADLTATEVWPSVVDTNIAKYRLESIRDIVERAATELNK